MVSIAWTDISLEDLKEIFDFIAEDSTRYATITANKIYQTAQLIARNPYVGRIVPEFNEKLIREVIEGNYRIIYRIKNAEQVDILRVFHSARLLKAKELD
jgi:plasmid stabilization system protein ParE